MSNPSDPPLPAISEGITVVDNRQTKWHSRNEIGLPKRHRIDLNTFSMSKIFYIGFPSHSNRWIVVQPTVLVCNGAGIGLQ